MNRKGGDGRRGEARGDEGCGSAAAAHVQSAKWPNHEHHVTLLYQNGREDSYIFVAYSFLRPYQLKPGEAPSRRLEEAWTVSECHQTQARGWVVCWSGSEQ